MIVDLLLPCIPFEVVIYPSDPSRLTDLEAASLYYVGHHEDIGHVRAEEVSAFIGLGDEIFYDMLIRMINRGWIKVQPDTKRLYLSTKAKEALEHQPEAAQDQAGVIAIRASEEGKRVWVCYDVIGGGYAVINRQFLSRSREDAFAVPPSNHGSDHEKAPYGIVIDGYAGTSPSSGDDRLGRDKVTAEGERNEILRALQADRRLRRNLFGINSGTVPHIRIRPPNRTLTIDDLYYYRCRFDVRKGRFDEDSELGAVLGIPADAVVARDVEPPPELICVEQRNPAIRRLGENVSEKIVHHATLAARRTGGDARFFKLLLRHAEGAAAVLRVTSDPLTMLRNRISELGKVGGVEGEEHELDDLRELWAAAQERVEILVSSGLDIAASRPVAAATHDETLATLFENARRMVLVSSPQLRLRSQQMTVQSIGLSGLSDLATEGKVGVLVHGVSGTTLRGSQLSDSQAISRLSTALGSSKVHVVDHSLDHLRTPFVQVDDNTFLWQSSSLFDDRSVHGLLLRLRRGSDAGSFAKLERSLPPGLRERLFECQPQETTVSDAPDVDWPADVVASVRAISGILDDSRAADLASGKQRVELAADLRGQLDFLVNWLKTASESVEPIVAARINERCFELLGSANDHEPVVIGVSGRSDIRAFPDLIEAISLRLQRQDMAAASEVQTFVCLPNEDFCDRQAAAFLEYFPSLGNRIKLIRGSERTGGRYRTGFIATSTTVILAQDGLINYVSTAGRHVKGTQLGLQLMGRKTRALAVDFLASEWPIASEALAAGAANGPPPTREPSAREAASLQATAHREDWFADGNRGAAKAFGWLSAGNSDLQTRADFQLQEARRFLAGPLPERRVLGYALAKAVAIAEGNEQIVQIGALALLATLAEEEDDLIVAAIFSDFLPEGSPYRDPLTRKLAYAVARGREPYLTPDELDGLVTPTAAALCLACLLMMDGNGGELADWLAYLPAAADETEEATLARTLATLLRETGSRILDLGHLSQEHEGNAFTIALHGIRDQITAARTRIDTGLVKPVGYLRDLVFSGYMRDPDARGGGEVLFVDKDNFVVKLIDVIEELPEGASEDIRKQILFKLLKKAQDTLGFDMLESGRATGTSLEAKTIARIYFDKKNTLMQEVTGREPVDIDKGGRNIQTALKKIFDLILHDLVPQLSGITTAAERDLNDVALSIIGSPVVPAAGTLGKLQALVRDRLLSAEASAALQQPAWRFPTLHSSADEDWAGRRRAILTHEFRADTKFHQVVQWFVDMDRRQQGSALPASGDVPAIPQDMLSLLYDLLEGWTGSVEEQDLKIAWQTLDVRLREVAGDARRLIAEARALAGLLSVDRLALRAAITAAEKACDLLDKRLQGFDLVGAVIQAGDLRANELHALRREWDEASKSEQGTLLRSLEGQVVYGRDKLRAVLERRVKPPISAKALGEARTAVRLAPTLSEPIRFEEALRLNVGEGRRPQADLDEATSLLAVFAAARRSEDLSALEELAGPSNVAQAVAGYLTGLPPQQHLALARREGDIWRISCSHPALTSLSFGASDTIEFLLPIDRDAELAVRKSSTAATSTTRMAVAGRQAVAESLSRSGSRAESYVVLLSLFISEIQHGLPVLVWRRMAEAAALPAVGRRITALAALADQRFPILSDLRVWWNGLGARRGRMVAQLLDLSEAEFDEGFNEDDFARHMRSLCLGLGINSLRDPSRLCLAPEGILAACDAWPESQSSDGKRGNFGVGDMVETLGRLLQNARDGGHGQASRP